MVVYVDVLFAFNLFIDAFMLVMTGVMRKSTLVWWRIILAAIVGASYVLFIFLPSLSGMFHFTAKVLISLIIVWIAFGYRDWQRFGKHVAVFYVLNFVAAGGVIGVQQILQSQSEFFDGIRFTSSGTVTIPLQLSIGFILLTISPIVWLFRQVVVSRRRMDAISKWVMPVEIGFSNYVIPCLGLLDTGNQLHEPMTGLPVMVCELHLWEEIIPKDVYEIISKQAYQTSSVEWEHADRIRYIPYRGIHSGVQVMIAIRPDYVSVNGVRVERVIIGLRSESFHHDNAYQIIIHPDLIHN
jgi:stage II sporulation protein GA (sporulation sigma-E factor processing peptidase)